MKYPLFLALLGWFLGCGLAKAQPTQPADQAQQRYLDDLDRIRRAFGAVPPVPGRDSVRFGMGDRRKLTYARGTLRDSRTGEVVFRWETRREIILPSEYTVLLLTRRGTWVTIRENQTGVLLREGRIEAYLTRSPLRLPTFRDHPHAPVLRVLHQQVLLDAATGLDSLGREVLRRTGNPDFDRTRYRSGALEAARWFLRLWNEKSPAR